MLLLWQFSLYLVLVILVYNIFSTDISMGWRGRDVAPLLTHWSRVFLALAHQYMLFWTCMQFFPRKTLSLSNSQTRCCKLMNILEWWIQIMVNSNMACLHNMIPQILVISSTGSGLMPNWQQAVAWNGDDVSPVKSLGLYLQKISAKKFRKKTLKMLALHYNWKLNFPMLQWFKSWSCHISPHSGDGETLKPDTQCHGL